VLLDAPLRTAYHATEILQRTFLQPPQAVALAGELARLQGRPYPQLTPQELAACFTAPAEARTQTQTHKRGAV
jgi:energy-coupling factor transport system ATP-binding protein